MEFLFVRWFGLDTEEVGGWETKKLHQIGFADGDEAFGFVDPADVVRAVHLIPRFSEGRTKDLLGPSFARSDQEKDEDWVRYYVNMYVYLISAWLILNIVISGLSTVICSCASVEVVLDMPQRELRRTPSKSTVMI
jgi:hypothetical protein